MNEARVQSIEKRCELLEANRDDEHRQVLENQTQLDALSNQCLTLQGVIGLLAMELPEAARLRFASNLIELVNRYGSDHPIAKHYLWVLHSMERFESQGLSPFDAFESAEEKP